MVDYPSVLSQLGVDCFSGHGWEAFDKGMKSPPSKESSPNVTK